MEILTINLAAGETKAFRKAGAYFEILTSTGNVGLNFYTLLGGICNTVTGAISGVYLRANFGAFDISNQYTAGQTVQVLVCDAGEDGGSRRQPGVVQVVDSGKELTKAGVAFADYGFVTAASATKYPTVQLWNPAGSGVRVIAERCASSISQASNINIAFGTTQAGTLRNQAKSKLQGGAAGLSQIRSDSTNSPLASAGQVARVVAANTPTEFSWREPWVILPGAGLNVWADLQASAIQIFADFEFREEPL